MLARSSALVSCVSRAVVDRMVGVTGTRMATGSSTSVRGFASLQSRLPQACRSPAGVCAGRLSSQQPLIPRSVLMHGRSLPAVSRFAAQAAATAEAPTEQSFEYQAEVDRLMDMIINSLYSNRDIFLRELVSNGSDALDKMRFVSLTDKEAMASGQDLSIRIRGYPEERKLIIEDSGIGMTRQEMLDSLGTIARSGTARFAEAMKEAKGDASLIGRFGVGFYSSFLVADRVEVQSKSNDDAAQWHFESALGSSNFKISQDQQVDLTRGTRVTLHLKEDAAEMASPAKLQTLIKQYSQFIQFPIRLWNSRQETDQVPDEAATAKKQAEADEAAKKEGKDQAEPVEPQTKSQPREEWDWAVQNDAKPLWTRSAREVTDAEYAEFFKQTFQEFMDPAAKVHFSAEGTIEFTALLFIPGMAPFQPEDGMKKPKNIKLFVRRVFISDEFDESLMPRYLSFAKGIVDSSDLPLNVSREILQESRVVRVIKKQLTKRTLDMLADLAKRPKPEGGEGERRSDYELFWGSFGKYLKLGIVEDQANRPQLAKLLRVHTSKSEDDPIPLSEYVSGMKEGQKGIYYIAADSLAAAAASPFVEQLQRRGLEVVYLTEVIDEPMFNHLEKFDGHTLIDVAREGVDLGDTEEEKQEAQAAEADLKPLMELMKEALGERVEKVVASQRLADSPCALATSKFGWSAYQERIMRSQLMADQQSQEYMRGRKTMELNPQHPIIQTLKSTASSNPGEAKAMTQLLYDAALVTSGFNVENPKDFGNRIYELMGSVLSSNGNGSAAAAQNARRQQRREGPKTEEVTADSIVEGDGGSSPWGN